MRNLLYPLAYPIRRRQVLRRWRRRGRPAPPPAYFKHDHLKRIVDAQPRLQTFIETGTWRGDTLYQLQNHFNKLHSIELNKELYAAAQKRLSRFKHIQLWQGHSPEVLPRILTNLNSPALIWLDAHYMGGPRTGYGVCPTMAELSAIFTYLREADRHIILIDDARNFTQLGDYPSLDEVTKHVKKHWPAYSVTVQDDMIHVQTRV
ncbi:MAG: hypothetical protein AAF902_21560 [Chloroflexota bacterium]